MYKITALILLVLSFSVFAKTEIIGLDVRSSFERAIMSSKGAKELSINDFSKDKIEKLLPNKESEIHVFCAAGVRAERAKKILTELGYKNVKNVGTYRKWNKSQK